MFENFDSARGARYVTAVYAALAHGAPLPLTDRCTECGEVPGWPNEDHITLPRPDGSAAVVIGCEGYYLINPNLVGIDAPDWQPLPADLDKTSQVVLGYSDDHVAVTVATDGNHFILTWNDYVTNEWSETYPALSIALARFAALMRCSEHNWDIGFVNTPGTFVAAAEQFLASEAS